MPESLKHRILNPTGEHSDSFYFSSYDSSNEHKAQLEDLKRTITPVEFINLIAGKYGHSSVYSDEIAKVFEGHPHNNPKNVDIAMNQLSSDDASSSARQNQQEKMVALLRHFQVSPKMIEKTISMPEKYGGMEIIKSGRLPINSTAKVLSNQKALTPDHIKKLLQHESQFRIEAGLLHHPAANLEIQKEIAQTPNAELDANAAEVLINNHALHGNLGPNPDQILSHLIRNNPHLGTNTFDKIADRMDFGAMEKLHNELLGIDGGKPNDGEDAISPETNWNNWENGDKFSHRHEDDLAASRHLTPTQAEHIMRHGDFDSKWNLFNNKRLGSKYADQMYEKWLNDDSDHGYDLDAFKEKIKEEHPFEYDDWYEEAQQAAEEDYPISTFIRDHYNDEDLMGEPQEDWIKKQLEKNHDWTHKLDDKQWRKRMANNDTKNQDWLKMLDMVTPGLLGHKMGNITKRDVESAGISLNQFPYDFTDHPDDSISSDDLMEEIEKQHPKEVDFAEDNDIESHPEYDGRHKEEENSWDEEVKRISERDMPDSVYDSYSESMSEDIHQRADRLYRDKMDNAHEDEEFLPDHLSAIAEIKRKQAEVKEAAAFKEAQAKEGAVKEKLDQYIPNRPKEHAYGEGQHHMELAKQYSDANKGSIDIGHLNKMYPNLTEKWKKIFGGKGKISSDELQQKIDALPKSKYNLSYGHWGPQNMQNLNGQDEMVVRLDHSPETLAALKKDPEAHDVFQKVNDASQRSGHPTNYNTIGWARVDFTNPKHPMVDELQSDFSSAARDYLAEHGETGQEKAKALDKIMHIQKNWREILLNAVTKIAGANGAEKLSTHSPESKAAHTGAGKVHSVYKDSYEKIPRQLGFKSAPMETLPLNEEGKGTFLMSRSGTPTEDLLSQHKEGMNMHARLWDRHKDLAENPVEIDNEPVHIENRLSRIAVHKNLIEHHAFLYKQHQQRLSQLDPSHELRTAKTPGMYVGTYKDNNPVPGFDYMGHAIDRAINHEAPVFSFDSALKQEPAVTVGHTGHTLPLAVNAFKKHIMVLDLLQKAQMKDDDKVAIAQALMNIKSQQEKIEQLKAQNPEAYDTISQLTEVLVDLFKELNNEPIEAVQHQLEAESAMAPQEQATAQAQGQAGFKPPPEEKPITHGPKTLPIGAERTYSSKEARQKSPSGEWISVQGGNKTQGWQ